MLEYTHTRIFNLDLDLFCFTKIGKVRGVRANRSLDAAEFGIAFVSLFERTKMAKANVWEEKRETALVCMKW